MIHFTTEQTVDKWCCLAQSHTAYKFYIQLLVVYGENTYLKFTWEI